MLIIQPREFKEVQFGHAFFKKLQNLQVYRFVYRAEVEGFWALLTRVLQALEVLPLTVYES